MPKLRSRLKAKGRKVIARFSLLPHRVQESANWKMCSASAIRLLTDLVLQFRGKNNGDLCTALTTLRTRGWTRSQTISIAARELCHYGLIQMTRQGNLHRPSLYALTWHPIDHCKGKLEISASEVPSNLWMEVKPRFSRKKRKNALNGERSDPERKAFLPSGSLDGRGTKSVPARRIFDHSPERKAATFIDLPSGISDSLEKSRGQIPSPGRSN